MRAAILALALLAGGCVRYFQVPATCAPCPEPPPCAGLILYDDLPTPPEDLDPELRPETCPDDGVHLVVNGVCVDTGGE
jgi:hypothetical protein